MDDQSLGNEVEIVKPRRMRKWLKIRIQPDELFNLKLKARKAEMNVSDYVRFCALGPHASLFLPHADVLSDIRAELRLMRQTTRQAVQMAHDAYEEGTIAYGHMQSLEQIFGQCELATLRLESTLMTEIRRRDQ